MPPGEVGSPPGAARSPAEVVVAIGASAGGLEALQRLLAPMSLRTGLAFVVVQHLAPDHRSLMPELLGRVTRLPCVPLTEATRPLADTLYLLPPAKELDCEGELLVPTDRVAAPGASAPISRFFTSLALARGNRAVAVVLSGTGSDGSDGVRAIHAAGGVVIAQRPDSARFDGMPRGALATGVVDLELAPEDIAAALADGPPRRPQSLVSVEPSPLPDLLAHMRAASGIDFGAYKPATIQRRIQRRIELGRHLSFEAYVAAARNNPVELDALCQDCLIGVTSFFRDPEAFQAVRESVVPGLLAQPGSPLELRVWVPGCSTGEEAYTLGMVLLEELQASGSNLELRIIASDVHREALRHADRGVYEADAVEPVPPALRDRYFVREHDGRWRVTPTLRKRILFVQHNLLQDVPFHRIDLVSCRNLLIYFGSEAQNHALAAFHFSLRPSGILLLGPAESLGDVVPDFVVVDRVWRIFRNAGTGRPRLAPGATPHAWGPSVPTVPSETSRPGGGSNPGLRRALDRLVARYVRAAVLVNEQQEVVHLFGDAGRYLRLGAGPLSTDLGALCGGELRSAVTVGLDSVLRQPGPVVVRGVLPEVGEPLIDVTVERVSDAAEPALFLVRFGPPDPTGEEPRPRLLPRPELEAELNDLRGSFAAMLESYESAREELQASNEELLAGNEELQSTNEELQSVNEELHTVNAEYNAKIGELAALSADLRNLMAASHAGVVFTDNELRIRLFTPGATAILNLLPQDVGRPLSHITTRIRDDQLLPDLERVRATGTPIETVAVGVDGRLLARRVFFYQDEHGANAGFAITITDVTARERAAASERQHRDLLMAIIDGSQAQIAVLDNDGVIVTTNRAWDQFGIDNGGQAGRQWVGRKYLLGPVRIENNDDEDDRAMTRAIEDVLAGRRREVDLDYRCDAPDSPRWFWMNVRALPAPPGGAVVTHTDITARKRAEQLERKLLESARLESLGMLAGGIAHDFNNILSGIVTNVELLQTGLNAATPGVPALAEPTAEILLAARRATQLCGQMLAYSGRGHFLREQIDLEALLKDTLSLVRSSLGRGIGLQLDLAGGPPLSVDGDPSQLQQVLMNLVINAAEAMAERGGAVRLRTGRGRPELAMDELEVVPMPEVGGSGVVWVEVADSGVGIAPSVIRKIFEPFHSSKFTGRGLGLSAVLGIIRGHGGGLAVWSEVGTGSRFRVVLPASRPAPAPTPTRTPTRPPPAPRLDAPRLLVVDDDPTVRRALERLLLAHRYDCTTAATGEDALALVAREPSRFQLAVVDLTMPDLDGATVMARLRELHPPIRVLLISGFSELDVGRLSESGAPDAFLQKPIASERLLSVLEALLALPEPTTTPAA